MNKKILQNLIDERKTVITGTMINYYYICKTKLWLFVNNIQLEENSCLVIDGLINHNNAYKREKKEINIDGVGKIDLLKKGYIYEVKRSSKMQKSAKMQLVHYLIKTNTKKGYLKFKDKKIPLKIFIDDKVKNEYFYVLNEIEDLVNSTVFPKPERKKICKKCAYEEFCFAE